MVKVSPRPPESLEWELDLLEVLAGAGVAVPVAVPTGDGHRHHDGVFVQPFIPGGPPATAAHWQAVAEAVTTVHQVTSGWPQRPGAASAAQLLEGTRGADADLDAMPPGAVALVRACWRALLDHPAAGTGGPASSGAGCVVHGDLGPGAVLVDGGRVALIDWDEARVDAPAFDLAALPDDVPLPGVPAEVDREVLRTAALAWETATCWVVEPDYARRCLDQLRQRTRTTP